MLNTFSFFFSLSTSLFLYIYFDSSLSIFSKLNTVINRTLFIQKLSFNLLDKTEEFLKLVNCNLKENIVDCESTHQ